MSAAQPATRVFPRLVVSDAARAIAFYRDVFGATEVACFRGPDGRVVHAELSLDGAGIYVKDADEYDPAPEAFGGTPVLLSLYVPDVDGVYARLVERGAEVIFPLATQFYGERGGRVRDPFGHVWLVATVVESLTAAEIDRRIAQNMG
jgi:uncharacterized glyoxalase superfamily protein PhnB